MTRTNFLFVELDLGSYLEAVSKRRFFGSNQKAEAAVSVGELSGLSTLKTGPIWILLVRLVRNAG